MIAADIVQQSPEGDTGGIGNMPPIEISQF